MRKRNIKSIYHWAIMFLTMGMPLLITATSYLPNAYNDNNVIEIDIPKAEVIEKQYQTNEITQESDIVFGNVYFLNSGTDITTSRVWVFGFDIQNDEMYIINGNLYDNSENLLIEDISGAYFILDSYNDYNDIDIQEADEVFNYYVVEETSKQLVVNNGAYQVYQFNQWFSNLGVNEWYNNVLGGFGMIPQTYTPLANILYLPLYGLWVLVFDLVFDTIALVPSLFHNLLDKAKGESE